MSGRFLNASSRLAGRAKCLQLPSPGMSGCSQSFQRCKSLSTTSFPEVVLDKKDLGKITLRPMTETDLNGVNDLIKTRKLIDFSESDIYSMLQSPDFLGLVAENEANEIVGFTGCMKYTKDIATAGHHVVAERSRGNGLSMAMTQYTREHLGGTPWYGYGYDHLELFYDKVGNHFDKGFGKFFRLVGRFGEDYIKEKVDSDAELFEAEHVDFRELCLFDERIHTRPRHSILHAMCFHPTTVAYVAVRDRTVVGYALLRKCFLSYKIAPVFAEDSFTAHALYQKLAARIPDGATVTMIVSPKNGSVENFMNWNHFKPVDTLWRGVSIHGYPIELPVDFSKVFSFTNTNFGLC